MGTSDFHPSYPQNQPCYSADSKNTCILWTDKGRGLDWLRHPDGRRNYKNEYVPLNQAAQWKHNVPLIAHGWHALGDSYTNITT